MGESLRFSPNPSVDGESESTTDLPVDIYSLHAEK
jgi:hypothetical protein